MDDPQMEGVAPQFADGNPDLMEACLRDLNFPEAAIEEWPEHDHPAWEDPRWDPAAAICIEDAGLGEYNGNDPEEIAAKRAMEVGMIDCLHEHGWDTSLEVLQNGNEELGPHLEYPDTDDPEVVDAFLADARQCGDEVGMPVLGPDPEQERASEGS